MAKYIFVIVVVDFLIAGGVAAIVALSQFKGEIAFTVSFFATMLIATGVNILLMRWLYQSGQDSMMLHNNRLKRHR